MRSVSLCMQLPSNARFVTCHSDTSRPANSLRWGGERSTSYVCCTSVRSHISERTRPNFTKFLSTLTVAVARSSSCHTALRYVLSVLWVTSCFHTIELTLWRAIFIPGQWVDNSQNYCIDSNQIYSRGKDRVLGCSRESLIRLPSIVSATSWNTFSGGSCLLVIVLCNLVLGITWCYWK